MNTTPKDKMTPKERMSALAKGERPDRVPCLTSPGQNSAPFFGYTSEEFNRSPKVMAEVLLKAFDKFRPDGLVVNPSQQGIPEALGCQLAFQKYGAPLIQKAGLTSYEELTDKEPVNPYKDGRLPYFIEVLEIVSAKLGDEVPISFSSGGPFTGAALFTGTDKFLKDMIRNPEQVHKVLELTTQSIINIIDVVCGMGFAYGPAEPLASTDLIRPRYFREFVLPYLKRITSHLMDKYGRKASIHICGSSRAIWPEVLECGFSAFSLDNVENIAEAAAAMGDKLTIVGNVSPVDILLNGSVADVLEASRRCIAEGMHSPKGYILAAGCEIPAGTKEENILAMMQAARLYGQYAPL